MWLTHFWHSWSQFFIFAWDVTAGGILRTGVLICLVYILPQSLQWCMQYHRCGTPKSPATICLVSSKITIVGDCTVLMMQGFEIVGLIFFCTKMHYKYFLRSWMCFHVSHFCSKYQKYTINQWRVLYTVCFHGDLTIKTVVGFLCKLAWKMCHTLKHFIHM